MGDLRRLYPIGGGAGEDGTDGFAAGFEERRGTVGGALGVLGRVRDDVSQGGEGLGPEIFVHRFAARRVDRLDVGDGALILLGRCEGVELGEGEVVGLADGDG